MDKKIKAYKRSGDAKKEKLKEEIETLNDAINKGYQTFKKEMGK